MDGVIAEQKLELEELSEDIYNLRRSLELTRKDRREAKELQRDELEVHPLIL